MPKPKVPGFLRSLLTSKSKSSDKQNKSKDNASVDVSGDTCDISMSSLQRRGDLSPPTPESLAPMLQQLHANEPRCDTERYGSSDESRYTVSGRSNSSQADAQSESMVSQSGQNSSVRTQSERGRVNVSDQSSPNVSSPPPQGEGYSSLTEPKQLLAAHNRNANASHTSMTSDYATMTPSSSLESGMPSSSGGGLGQPRPASLVNAMRDRNPELAETRDSMHFSADFSGRYPTVIERNLNQGPTVCIEHPPGAGQAGAKPGLREHHTAPVAPVRTSKQAKRPSHHSVPVAAGAWGGWQAPDSSTQIRRPFVDVASSDSDGELFPESALSTPVGALRKSRKRLCLMLNIEQPMVDTDFPPDYTGLAEMLGFETIAIQNFWEQSPTDTLLREWASCHDGSLLTPVLKTLVECLQKLGRQDVLDDCRGLILEDVRDFIAEQQLLKRYTVERLEKFDCYVNIAEQDLLTTGREILDTLEGVYKLRLCLTLRDVTLGGCQYEKMAEMLETRCDSKVVIVLTKSYADSDACQFLTQFAVTLDPGSRRNKLIPLLVDEEIVIPRVLRCLAMLNYRRDKRLGFLWPRLKHAISQ